MDEESFGIYFFKRFSKKKLKKLREKYNLLTPDSLKHRFDKLLRTTVCHGDKGARDRAAILYLNADDHVKNELDEISKEYLEMDMKEFVDTVYFCKIKDEDEKKLKEQLPDDLNIDDLRMNEERIHEIQEYLQYLGKKRLKIGLFFLVIGILVTFVTYLFSWYLGWSVVSWGMIIFGLAMTVMSAAPRSNAKKLSNKNLSKEGFTRIIKEYYRDDFDEKF